MKTNARHTFAELVERQRLAAKIATALVIFVAAVVAGFLCGCTFNQPLIERTGPLISSEIQISDSANGNKMPVVP